MKKTTIALLTAAAMGTSGAVMAANHGPEISGRVDMSITNFDGEKTSFSDRSTVVGVGGSTELTGGLTGGYFVRGNYTGARTLEADYAFLNVSGDFGTLQFGRDDDIVYKFVTVPTDIFRTLSATGAASFADTTTPVDDEHIQYHLTVDAFTFGGYVDTSGVNGGDEDGINNYQIGGMFDYGMGRIAVVYADSDDTGESELYAGATLDLDVVSLAGYIADDSTDNNPYVVTASVPLNGMLTGIAGYGDDDNGTSNSVVGLVADLGGGLDARIEYASGDGDEGFALNARYSF